MRSNKIINLYHHNANNIGDRLTGPAQYIFPDQYKARRVAPIKDPFQNVIIGGGQIFGDLGPVASSIKAKNSKAKLVAWGIGLPPLGSNDKDVSHSSSYCDLVGTRNYQWRDTFAFVPCASCLAPEFDTAKIISHEVVIYLHKRKGPQLPIPAGVPVMNNGGSSAQAAIDFIGSGKTVVTSSYHGVYWAQLLGRKVVCLPYNNKFETFQHQPTFADETNWEAALSTAIQTDPLLEEYRSLNKAFATQVEKLFDE